jgi:hypothetical protein
MVGHRRFKRSYEVAVDLTDERLDAAGAELAGRRRAGAAPMCS